MNKKVIPIYLIVVLSMFFACNKQDKAPKPVLSEAALINDAHKYFNTSVSKDPDLHFFPEKIPLWGAAKAYTQESGQVVVVPVLLKKAKYIYMTDGNHVSSSELTYLYIYEDGNKQKHVEVVTKMPAKDYTFGQEPFIGATKIEDWNGKFIRAWVNNADKTVSNASLTTSYRPVTTETTAPILCTVTNWYDCRTVDEGLNWDCTYLSTTTVCADGPPSGGGGGGAAGGGGTSNGPPPPVLVTQMYEIKEIRDSLKNPCFKKALKLVGTGGIFTGAYSMLLHEFYGSKANSKITISEGVVRGDAVAETNGSVSSIYARARTVLSSDKLKNSSMEYLVATIMHEFVHGYLLSHPPDPTAVDKDGRDHNQMTKDWVNTLAAAMTEIFPDLKNSDALALTWGGLERTDAYKALSQTEKNEIDNVNLYHKLGIDGTKCK